MKVKRILCAVATCATVSLLGVSCKKNEVLQTDAPKVTIERSFGVVPDDPQKVEKVPVILSADFITARQTLINNQLRLNPGKSGSKDDTSPPTVNITSPSNGASVSPGSTLNITVSASDNKAVTLVSISIDGTVAGSSGIAPCNFSWNTTGAANGTHTITATAQDAAGNSASVAVVVTINATVITTPPSTSAYQIAMPPVSNQGSEGSCVSFAVGYNTRSAEQYFATHAGSYSYSTNIFSPEYLFDQTKIDASCSGSSVYTALEFLKTNGISTWQSMPYSSSNGCSLIPSSSQATEAAAFKISSYSVLSTSDITAVKAMLSANHPLIISFMVDSYFYYAGPGFIWKSFSSTLYGRHAVAVCGFDDSKHAYKIINSWGTGWGDAGYAWIDYDFLPTACTTAYVINQ